MRLNDKSIKEIANRFIAKRIDAIKGIEPAREVLDDLLGFLAEQGYDEEDTFGIHLAVEEAIMRRLQQD